MTVIPSPAKGLSDAEEAGLPPTARLDAAVLLVIAFALL
jgi:hypothetical protein